MASMLKKFQGALVGGIVGDCLGAVFEGYDWSNAIETGNVIKLINTIEEDYKAKQDGSAKKCRKSYYTFTDDSAMARSVAKSLVQNNGLNITDMAKRFTEEYLREPNRGYGGSVTTVFTALEESEYSDVYGPAKSQFEGMGSYGNGGAMRISPAGVFAHKKDLDFSQLRDLTEKITMVTHSHIQAIQGALLQSYTVRLALKTTTLNVDTFLQELINKMQILEQEALQEKQRNKEEIADNPEEMENCDQGDSSEVDGKAQEPDFPYCTKLAKIRDFVKRDTLPTATEIRDELGVFIAAYDAVPAAIYCFLRATRDIEGLENRNPFERMLIYSISLGGDTDTVATMACSIAGAYYGLDIIPDSWQMCCEGRLDAMKDAEALYNLT